MAIRTIIAMENQAPSDQPAKSETTMMPRAQMLPMTMATLRNEKSRLVMNTTAVRATTRAPVAKQAGMRISPGLPLVTMAV